MIFEPVNEKDYLKYKGFLMSDEMTCENSFLNATLWRSFDYNYAVYEGCLTVRISEGDRNYYFLPIGENMSACIDKIFEIENDNPVFCLSEGGRMERFVEKYGYDFELIEIPENFEYIYLQEDLAELKGKKYHQKRNHISAFSRKYNWNFLPMTRENCYDALAVTDTWISERDDEMLQDLIEERNSLERVLKYFDELELVGGIVYVDSKPVAFALGTALNHEVFDINIEKALSDYQGAYAVINNAFAKTLSNFRYINREDDLGIEGLRKAKLSYYPNVILKKYIAIKK